MKPSHFILLQLNASLNKQQTTTHTKPLCGKLGLEIHNLLFWAMLTLVLWFNCRPVSLLSSLSVRPSTRSPPRSCEQMHEGFFSLLDGSGRAVYLKPNTVGCLDTLGSVLGC